MVGHNPICRLYQGGREKTFAFYLADVPIESLVFITSPIFLHSSVPNSFKQTFNPTNTRTARCSIVRKLLKIEDFVLDL